MNYRQETERLEPSAQVETSAGCYVVSFDEISGFDCTDVHATSEAAWRQAFEIVATTKVARAFSTVLRRWLTPDQMREVVRLNAAEPAGSGVCHSHDFCDANMAMLEAFTTLGLPNPVDLMPDEDDESGDDPGGVEAEQDFLRALWNAAWDAAAKSGFTAAKSGFTAAAGSKGSGLGAGK